MKKSLLVVIYAAVPLVFASCSGNNNNENNNSVINVQGEWHGQSHSTVYNANYSVKATIDQSGSDITALLITNGIDSTNATGKIDGSSITYGSTADSINFKGAIETADSMDGTWTYGGANPDSGTWWLIKGQDTGSHNFNYQGDWNGQIYRLNGMSVDTVNVTDGKWKGEITENASADSFTLSGNMLIYYNNATDTISKFTSLYGSINSTGDSIKIYAPCSISGSTSNFVFGGQISGSNMSGTWVITTSAVPPLPSGSGNWQGTKN